eukprot:3139909-Prymnesium_polylepis.1
MMTSKFDVLVWWSTALCGLADEPHAVSAYFSAVSPAVVYVSTARAYWRALIDARAPNTSAGRPRGITRWRVIARRRRASKVGRGRGLRAWSTT